MHWVVCGKMNLRSSNTTTTLCFWPLWNPVGEQGVLHMLLMANKQETAVQGCTFCYSIGTKRYDSSHSQYTYMTLVSMSSIGSSVGS